MTETSQPVEVARSDGVPRRRPALSNPAARLSAVGALPLSAPTGAPPLSAPTGAPPLSAPTGAPAPTRASRWSSGRLRRPARRQVAIRFGVRPYLFALDAGALGLAAWVADGARGRDLVLVAVTLGLYAAAGLYRPRLSLSLLDDLPQLLGRVIVAGALTGAASLLVDRRGASPRVLAAAAIGAAFILVVRGLAYAAVRRVRSRGRIRYRTLLIGAGQVGGHLAGLLLEHPEYGLTPVGFLDSDPLLSPDGRPVPVLGSHDELSAVLVAHDIRVVIIAFGATRESQMVDIIRTCDRLDCEIFFVPRLFELHHTSHDMDQVWGLPLVRLRRAAYRTVSWRLKRLFDVVAAALAIVVLSPVLLACAAAVRLDGDPGVLFRQRRVGLDGRPFDVLKFRTLAPDGDEESATRWSIAADGRVTPIGRFLRKTSLDELPQLFNIVQGNMSVVGPRPERPYFVDQFTAAFPRYTARHRVPSGLTGWAQVHGLRGDTSIAERARFDNYYIENWSLWTDTKIIARTVAAVLRGTGR